MKQPDCKFWIGGKEVSEEVFNDPDRWRMIEQEHLPQFRPDVNQVRTFESGATRDIEDGKLDFEAFFSPFVLTRYAEYMHEHRKRADGTMRDGDDWQKGIPVEVYKKSLIRHVLELWRLLRSGNAAMTKAYQDILCAILFNTMGLLHEALGGKR